MGFDVSNWGPFVWSTIHIVALGAPPSFKDDSKRREAYARFYNTLPDVLPCRLCGDHMRKHLRDMPVEGHLDGGRQSLFEWTVRFHNAVSRDTGRTPEMSVEDAFAYWKRVCEGGVGVVTRAGRKRSLDLRSILHVLGAAAAGLVAAYVIWRFVLGGRLQQGGRRVPGGK